MGFQSYLSRLAKQLGKHLFHPFDLVFLIAIVLLTIAYFFFGFSQVILLVLVLALLAATVIFFLRFFTELIIFSDLRKKLSGPSTYQKIFQLGSASFYLRYDDRVWGIILPILIILMILILGLVFLLNEI